MQEYRSHVLQGDASFISKGGVGLATDGMLTKKQRKKVVKVCILPCNIIEGNEEIDLCTWMKLYFRGSEWEDCPQEGAGASRCANE